MLSDEGPHALTIIVFLGTVFSPFYFRARRLGGADPLDHPAINVVLYGPRKQSGWVFTERQRGALSQGPTSLTLGPSSIGWEGDALVVRFAERRAPGGAPLEGEVRLHPSRIFHEPVVLDSHGRHLWLPVAPRARAEVRLTEPGLCFSGSAYHDSNWGEEPLEEGFRHWNWSRAELAEGTAVLYDAHRRDGSTLRLGRVYGTDGSIAELEAPTSVPLPRTLFRVPRVTRVDAGGSASLARTLEDTPFYNRSELKTALSGQAARAVHEAVDLDRFKKGWVQFMLPYRMRRER